MADLVFHILDISDRDEEVVKEDTDHKEITYESGDDGSDEEVKKTYNAKGTESFVVHLFGSTADGTPVRVDCKGFNPYFYLRIPDGVLTGVYLEAVNSYIKKCLKDVANKVKLTLVKRKVMYGYTGNTLFNFIELKVPSLKLFRNCRNLFLVNPNEGNDWDDSEKKEKQKKMKQDQIKILLKHLGSIPRVYEANFDPYLRFLHLRNLKPCDWCIVKEGMAIADKTEAGYVIEDCDWEDIGPYSASKTAPFKLASWDIECWSASGDFPVPSKDPVIQIGTIVTELGSQINTNHIFVLGTCDAIPGAYVHSFKTEKGMLKAWFQWICKQGIDILTGYNIFGFDEEYVWKRCEALRLVDDDYVQQMNRLCEYDSKMKLEEKRLSSSAMGDNFLHLWKTVGRLRIDLYHAIKRQYPMASYKLDDVSRAFLNDQVKKTQEGIAKQGASPGRALVLLNENGESISEKCTILSVDGANIVFEVPVDVDAQDVAKWAIVKDDLSPQEMFKKHCGSSADRALIAAYCIQDCQLVLDMFKKLDVFNNAAAMANVCSVPIAHIFLRGQGIKIESLIFKYCHENKLCIEVMNSSGYGNKSAEAESYEGAIVLDPIPGFYKVPVGVADFASLYPSTIISENISHDTLVWTKDYDLSGNFIKTSWGNEQYDKPDVPCTDIEFDTFGIKEGDERKNPEKVKTGTRVCRYAQDKQGAIPIIIAQLLDARKKTRALIKTEADPFKKALLDSQQNAYKVTANSLYGQLGSSVFKIRLQALAASTTAYGRKQIMFAKDMIEEFYGKNDRCDAKIVYGDTDSLFVCFNPKKDGVALEGKEALVETIRLTEEAGKLITQALKNPHDFEFDKVYSPFLIFSKKRYVGHKYEDDPDHYALTSMGIALKRRDYAPIVKKIYGGAINILLIEKNVAKAAEFVKAACKDLIEGKYGLGPLTITKSLRAEYANPNSIAHKVLAERIAKRSPGDAPSAGSRLGYVYVQAPVGQVAPDLQGDRIETPAYIKEKGLKVDYMFYIDHQISNPVCQVFGLLVEQVPGYTEQVWNENPDKEVKQRENLAYDLLFKEATQANTSIAKTNFMKMLGSTNVIQPKTVPRAVKSPTTVLKRPPVKQSSIDNFFVDSQKLTARQQALKKVKAAVKAEVDAMIIDA